MSVLQFPNIKATETSPLQRLSYGDSLPSRAAEFVEQSVNFCNSHHLYRYAANGRSIYFLVPADVSEAGPDEVVNVKNFTLRNAVQLAFVQIRHLYPMHIEFDEEL